MSLFDRHLEPADKQLMATTLLQIPKPAVYRPEKPEFPIDTLRDNDSVELHQLLGPRSWLLFDLLQDDGTWLNQPPAAWHLNQQYLRSLHVVERLSVVNDAAERGVKDIQDYANAAKDGSSRERMVLVSNSHRIKIPKFLKNEMEEHM